MKLVWITDPHLDFLPSPPMGSLRFGEWLNKMEGDAVVITGDIAEGYVVADLLEFFAAGYKKPVYFVLGNHDYYKSSFLKTQASVRKLDSEFPLLTWLDESGIIELTPDIALVGSGGWYDVRSGKGEDSRLIMSDFTEIEDFRGSDRHTIIDKCRVVAKEMADNIRPVLMEAASKYKHVYFATHVPPFREATWHNGKLSDGEWLPWFSNLTMGNVLSDAAFDYPDTKFTVLCGHTHSPGVFDFTSNMTVLTGKAQYKNPQIAKVFNLDSTADKKSMPGPVFPKLEGSGSGVPEVVKKGD